MNKYLKEKEYMPFAPDSVGDKVRANHCGRSAKSMVVERTNDGTVSAKCFRCGAFGKNDHKNKPSIEPKSLKDKDNKLPIDVVYAWKDWNPLAINYVDNKEFTEEESKELGLGWSESMHRMIIPVSNNLHRLAGWQAKSFTGTPRYLSFSDNKKHMYYQRDNFNPLYVNSVVITEDVMSAFKCSQLLSSFAILTTKITNQMKHALMQYDRFYIWLDNDNSQVRVNQLKLHNTLSLFGDSVIIKSDKEPKEMKQNEINLVLKRTKF